MCCVEAPGQPRDFARGGIPGNRTFGSCLVENLHRGAQCVSGSSRIGTGNRFEGALGGSAHAGFDRMVAKLAFQALTETLFRRRMNGYMRHIIV